MFRVSCSRIRSKGGAALRQRVAAALAADVGAVATSTARGGRTRRLRAITEDATTPLSSQLRPFDSTSDAVTKHNQEQQEESVTTMMDLHPTQIASLKGRTDDPFLIVPEEEECVAERMSQLLLLPDEDVQADGDDGKSTTVAESGESTLCLCCVNCNQPLFNVEEALFSTHSGALGREAMEELVDMRGQTTSDHNGNVDDNGNSSLSVVVTKSMSSIGGGWPNFTKPMSQQQTSRDAVDVWTTRQTSMLGKGLSDLEDDGDENDNEEDGVAGKKNKKKSSQHQLPFKKSFRLEKEHLPSTMILESVIRSEIPAKHPDGIRYDNMKWKEKRGQVYEKRIFENVGHGSCASCGGFVAIKPEKTGRFAVNPNSVYCKLVTHV